MTTEYEELLLSPEKLEQKLHDNFDAMNCGLLPEQNEYIMPVMMVAAKAQLDKLLNGKWLDKPDSEGWWWFLKDGYSVPFSAFVDIQENDVLVCSNWKAEWLHFDKLKGKWQKAIVPNPPSKE